MADQNTLAPTREAPIGEPAVGNTPENTTGSSPAVSIVVPVYNRERYLERCLDSLVFQTFQDIEIVVVNDGSTDSSQQIIDRYASLFPNLVVPVVKENGGPSSARRRGLEVARSRYISFVDSDDWIHPCAMEMLLDKTGGKPYDLVYARSASVHEGETKVKAAGRSLKNSEELKHDLLVYGNNSMCGKLWARELLTSHAQFPDMLHEDCVDVPVLISYAETIAYVDTALYYYFKSTEASITSVNHDPRRRDLFLADEMAYKSVNPDYLDSWRMKIITRLSWNLGFFDFFDEMVEYAKRSYEQFDLGRVVDDVPLAKRNALFDILEMGEPEIPKRLVLPLHLKDEYPADIGTVAFGPEAEIVWVDVDDYAPRDSQLQGTEGAESGIVAEGEHSAEGGTAAEGAYTSCTLVCAMCKAILDNGGGFYFSPRTRVAEALNPLVFNTGVFAFESCDRVSGNVIAGAPQSQALQAILREYELDLASGASRPPEKLMADALVCSCGVHLTGERQEANDVLVLGVEEYAFGAFKTDSTLFERLDERDGATAARSESLQSLLDVFGSQRDALNAKVTQSNSKATQLRRNLTNERKKTATLEKQVKELRAKARNKHKSGN